MSESSLPRASAAAIVVAPAPLALALSASADPAAFLDMIWRSLLVVELLGAPVAAFHFLFFGLPLYLVLSSRTPIRWWHAALAGSATGFLPVGVVTILSKGLPQILQNPGSLSLALAFGFAGLVGGLAFRATLREPLPSTSLLETDNA